MRTPSFLCALLLARAAAAEPAAEPNGAVEGRELQAVGPTLYCVRGQSPLFTDAATAAANSPFGTSTLTNHGAQLGDGNQYYLADGYSLNTVLDVGPCMAGSTLLLIPIHLLPKHVCGNVNSWMPYAERYPYASAAEAQAGCQSFGCSSQLAPLSAVVSGFYAWKGGNAAGGKATTSDDACYAAWFENDINFQTTNAYEQVQRRVHPKPPSLPPMPPPPSPPPPLPPPGILHVQC